MSGPRFLATVVASQLLVLLRGEWGPWAPDPLLPLLVHGALVARRRHLLGVALLGGWLRGLVLLEPAGGHVLAALAALAVVMPLRRHASEAPVLVWIAGSVLAAAACCFVGLVLSLFPGLTVTAGREVVLGAGLALLLAPLAARSVAPAPAT